MPLVAHRPREAIPLDVPTFRPARILLRAPNPLGDAAMAEPAARAIAVRFPDARIDVQVPRALAPLARAWGFPHAVLPVYAGHRAVEYLDQRWTAWRLARRRYDLCVLFPNSLGSARLAARARIPLILGYARDGRDPLLTHPMPFREGPLRPHMVTYYWGLAEALGCGPVPGREALAALPRAAPAILGRDARTAPQLLPTPAMRSAARRLLDAAGVRARPYVVVSPSAAYGETKRWPPEAYGELCGRLHRDLGWPCLVVGSARERALGPAVAAGAALPPTALVDLVGRADVGGLIGLLADAGLFVGNDSGPAHLAAALGVRGVAVFGSTSVGHSGPVGPGIRTVGLDLPCAPCFAPRCPLGHLACLRELPVERVLEAARAALETGHAD